jgi:hypothetical protein
MLNLLEYMFLLPAQFLDYMSKLSLNWFVAVVFKYFKLEIRRGKR